MLPNNERYVKLKKLGEGAFSNVYLCRDDMTNEHLAVKQVRDSLDDNSDGEHDEHKLNADREIAALSSLRHDNIVRMYHHYRNGQRTYIVLELMDSTLKSYMDNIENMHPLLIKSYMCQLLHAMAYLHECGYVHRDIKSANILIDKVGRIVISDFGSARRILDDVSPSQAIGAVIKCATFVGSAFSAASTASVASAASTAFGTTAACAASVASAAVSDAITKQLSSTTVLDEKNRYTTTAQSTVMADRSSENPVGILTETQAFFENPVGILTETQAFFENPVGILTDTRGNFDIFMEDVESKCSTDSKNHSQHLHDTVDKTLKTAKHAECFMTSSMCTIWYRAPELLLGGKKDDVRHDADGQRTIIYGTAVDMWSIGCVFAEMATRCGTACFQGDCAIDQLYKIFAQLGTPDESVWPGISAYSNYKSNFPKWPKREMMMEHLDQLGNDLLNKLLTYDPSKRITAKDALKHAYFDELRPKRTSL